MTLRLIIVPRKQVATHINESLINHDPRLNVVGELNTKLYIVDGGAIHIENDASTFF